MSKTGGRPFSTKLHGTTQTGTAGRRAVGQRAVPMRKPSAEAEDSEEECEAGTDGKMQPHIDCAMCVTAPHLMLRDCYVCGCYVCDCPTSAM
eukprot:1149033-Pelagomonas_calceolata.AAC.3